MSLSAKQLAMRDLARAALMGAVADQGANFGFGDDYGFGDDEMGADDPYSADYGFGAPRPRRPAPRRPQGAHPAAWSNTENRTLLLDPNRNSSVKVQRYSFSLVASNIAIATPSTIASFFNQPSTSVKPQRMVTNAPAPGFWYITMLQVANVNVLVGSTEDAYTYSALAQNVLLDLPRVDPQNKVTSAGNYSGSTPQGFSAAAAFTPILTLQGPAVLAGGYGQ